MNEQTLDPGMKAVVAFLIKLLLATVDAPTGFLKLFLTLSALVAFSLASL